MRSQDLTNKEAISSEISVSVVICTYNPQTDLFHRVLQALKDQTFQRDRFEVIIIDNGSTPPVDKEILDAFGLQGMLTIEPRPGLSHARRTGVSKSIGELIIFVDDDNLLSPHYLRVANNLMSMKHDVGAAGGSCMPQCDAAIPEWFWSYAHQYAVGVQSPESADVTPRGFVWGAGMVARRQPLLQFYQLGLQSALDDRTGKNSASGGDSELCRWFIAAGFKLWYDIDLKLTHVMPPERLTIDHLRKITGGHADSKPVLDLYDSCIAVSQFPLYRKFVCVASNLFTSLVSLGIRGDRNIILFLLKVPSLCSSTFANRVVTNMLVLKRFQKDA